MSGEHRHGFCEYFVLALPFCLHVQDMLTRTILQWARLIGGVGSSQSSSKQSTGNNPQQRLARFKRTYGQLLVGSHRWYFSCHVLMLTLVQANMARQLIYLLRPHRGGHPQPVPFPPQRNPRGRISCTCTAPLPIIRSDLSDICTDLENRNHLPQQECDS